MVKYTMMKCLTVVPLVEQVSLQIGDIGSFFIDEAKRMVVVVTVRYTPSSF